MKIYLIFISILITSCNAFEFLTNSKSSIDNDFSSKDLESLEDSLIGFWNLNEQTAGSTKTSFKSQIDLFDTTSVGLSVVPGRFGNAVDCESGSSGSGFLQSNTFSSIPLPSSAGFSLSFWIKLGIQPTTGFEKVIHFGPGGSVDFGDLGGGSTDFGFRLMDGSVDVIRVNSLTNFDTNNWNHVVINSFQNNSENRIFVNGEEQIGAFSNGVGSFAITRVLLCSDSAGTQSLQSKIDSVGIWERALTHDEIEVLSSETTQLD